MRERRGYSGEALGLVGVGCPLLRLKHHAGALRGRDQSKVSVGTGARDKVRRACCIVQCDSEELAGGKGVSTSN
jgi:hypothetical protein